MLSFLLISMVRDDDIKTKCWLLAPITVKILVNRLVPKDERFARLQRRAGPMFPKMPNISAPKNNNRPQINV